MVLPTSRVSIYSSTTILSPLPNKTIRFPTFWHRLMMANSAPNPSVVADAFLPRPATSDTSRLEPNLAARLSSVDLLLAVSLLYLFIPCALFAFGWLQLHWAMIFSIVLAVSVWCTLQETRAA